MQRRIECTFCYRKCHLKEGEVGACRVRLNDGIQVRPIDQQRIVAVHLDQIEKKPLYHFFPFEKTLSLGALGCNLGCLFCQNYQLSQEPFFDTYSSSPYEKLSPIQTLKMCHSFIMSYTYNEPIVWQDRVIEIAKQVKEENYYNVLVTNGTFSSQALERLSPFIDALNIDFKGDERFYKELCLAPGAYQVVCDSIEYFAKMKGVTLEVTTLIIEKYHTPEMIRAMATQLANLGVKVLHLSRFFPDYKMSDIEPTSISYLKEAAKIAKECKIEYVYLGNVSLEDGRFIVCPSCQHKIERTAIASMLNENNKLYCPICHKKIYGTFG